MPRQLELNMIYVLLRVDNGEIVATKGRTSRKSTSSKKTEEESKRSHALALRQIEAAEKVLIYLILTVGAVFSLYVAVYLPIVASAGQTTTISYVVDFLTKIRADVVVSWVATAGTTWWGYSERCKRIRERESKDERIKKLEEKLDPTRTSSNLTPAGEKAEE